MQPVVSPDIVSGARPIDTLILYGTEACHLCHEAERLLRDLVERGVPLAWEEVDIADNDALFERYGLSIPVLRHADGRELAWPFDAAALQRFVIAR